MRLFKFIFKTLWVGLKSAILLGGLISWFSLVAFFAGINDITGAIVTVGGLLTILLILGFLVRTLTEDHIFLEL